MKRIIPSILIVIVFALTALAQSNTGRLIDLFPGLMELCLAQLLL